MEDRIEEFLERSFEEPIVRLERDDLRVFIELAGLDGITIVDWHTKGIPAPDVLQGVFQVRPEAAELLFKHLTSLRKWYWHDWFPYGIPVPDGYLVKISNVGELGR